MKIHIIGAGVVGLATGRGFARFGHEVMYSDISDEALDSVQGEAECYAWPDASIPEADIHFVCVPEEAAPDVVRRIAATWSPPQPIADIVIRSSVPPGTTEALAKELPLPAVLHNPEFLKEATAEDDFLWACHTIVGIPSERDAGNPGLEELYFDLGVEVTYCSSTESEMVKLLTNTYLAAQISFWNEVKSLCDHAGVNSHRVARLVALDSRVSKYGAYKHGAPYGGRCLPKDVKQMLKFGMEKGGHVGLLRAIQEVNKRLGGE